ncbi:MAG: hypothetical protein CFH41_02579 [Alphaproteobacteria bacterium MarineAlpha11_Bin1]|nr:MAG: hypothetical protein CFH41_02579 [Alphaproteobacteria bacterium MarineAlpha11_Bin1]
MGCSLPLSSWIRISIGSAATLLIGMGLGRFAYTPRRYRLWSMEAGLVGAFNPFGHLVGALISAIPRKIAISEQA